MEAERADIIKTNEVAEREGDQIRRGEDCRQTLQHPAMRGAAKEPRMEWSENHRGKTKGEWSLESGEEL